MPIQDVITAVKDHTKRANGYSLYRDYEQGRHRYPFATHEFRTKYRWIIENSRANMCPGVRANFTDRVELKGWSGAGKDAATAAATGLGLGRVLNLAVAEAFRTGDADVLAWEGADGTIRPWYHRADQVAYSLDPEDPTLFLWVSKLWVTTDRYGRVNVYYPDRVERWVTRTTVRTADTEAPTWPEHAESWRPFNGDGDPDTITHQHGRVPWAHLAFDPVTHGGHGRSVLRDVIPLQDALNHALASMIVNVEQYAAPIRAILNHVPTKVIDPATGRQTEEALRFDETRKRILGIAGAGPFTQLDPPDANNIISVMDSFGAWIARTVGVPVSDIVPDLGNIPSGAALRVLAARRTATIRDFTGTITPEITTLMGLLGVEDASPEWADPAPADDTERVATAQVKRDLGYPLEEILTDLGEDPDDVDRIVGLIAAEDARVLQVGREAVVTGQTPRQAAQGM